MHDKGVLPFVVRGTEILPTDTSHQRLQKLARITLDEMFQLVGVLDTDGILLECNRAALEGGGLTRAEVIGKPFWETFWWTVTPQTQADLRDAIARAARGEFVRYDVEVFARKSGKEIMVMDFTLLPVKDEQGRVVYLLPEGRDITEKKAHEREIAQKNIELQGLLERIRELDEIKTQFFANVSHELRTPLALILGPAQRLIDDEATMTPEQRREAAQVIVRSARMLLRHVNDLLDVSKIDAGRLKIYLEDVDVAELVRFFGSHFAVLAAERGIDYVVDADGACVTAVDSDKLQRVLMNLLANAFKFVPDGGRVRCALRESAGEMTISIDDSGPGVKPELRQAIFERFRQGDGGVTRKTGGTGLGLAIAKEFVEMHRGRIEVLGSDFGGARFQVTLPLLRLAPDAAPYVATESVADRSMLNGLIEELRPTVPTRPADTAAPPRVIGKPRVLVVEDNRDMNRFITQCLSTHYEVLSAFDGHEGLQQALTFRPTVVVADIMMPNVSGVEMIGEMRKMPELREMPILLLSAKADEELMVKLLDEGAQDFIVKPFSEKDLSVRVRNLILAEQAREETTKSLVREHEARQEAELQKQLLHSLFMQAPTLILVLRGPQHVIVMANPPMCRAWGLEEEDILNRPLVEVRPELRNQIFPSLLDRVFRTGIPHVGRETPGVARPDADAEPQYYDYVYTPFRNVAGEVEGVFVVASDVTEQLRSREQINSLREAAEDANRAKDEFLAMLGHELRNPLSPILTALQLMKLPGSDRSERARTVIERQVIHLTRLVDDLLDVSRIARGKVELKPELVEMAEVVAKAIEMASPLLEQRTHTLTVDVPRQGLCVHGDVTRLSQVVSNLVTNAAKYTPPGGHITVQASVADTDVVLRVRDTGIGIAPDVLPRIFDLFVQERQAIDRSQGGLGLGLTIVRNLIERHGGSVSAHSDGPGNGSEFVVRLPRATAMPGMDQGSPASISSHADGPPIGAPRILIVDDNEDAAEMLAEMLSRKGYQTRVAHDAPTALRIAVEFMPSAAFLDLGLPVMDGYELASHLRDIPGLAELQLIAVTGYGQDSDLQKTRAAGFHHHLVKPVDLDAIDTALQSII